MADALAAEILEIAGFVDLHHVVLNFLREAAFVVGLHGRGERLGAVVDHLGRFQDFFGGLLHAFDCGAELTGGAGHVSVAAIADEGGKFAHGVGDGGVEFGEFALERLHLAVGRIGPSEARRRGLGVYALTRCLGVCGRVVTEHPLDAKNFALHATSPATLNFCFYQGAINARFRPGRARNR